VRATIGSDDIFKRDFSAPTGEDRFDKSMLPKVMQVLGGWNDA
jgi:microfibrillar-associated protein 1